MLVMPMVPSGWIMAERPAPMGTATATVRTVAGMVPRAVLVMAHMLRSKTEYDTTRYILTSNETIVQGRPADGHALALLQRFGDWRIGFCRGQVAHMIDEDIHG